MSAASQNIETTTTTTASEETRDPWAEPAPSTMTGPATGGKKKDKAHSSIRRRLLSHGWILKNMPFFLFLAALAVIYIYNGHYADKIVRDINRTDKELKELQYEYKTLKSEVMFRSKQSELAKAVGPFGLKELTAPPFVIVDSTK